MSCLKQEDVLKAKCSRALNHQRKRAKKNRVTLKYNAHDLVELALASQTCYYCKAPLSFGFTFDHRMPVSRTVRSHELTNLCCCCLECNLMKGCLDEEEFRRLRWVLQSCHPAAQVDVRRRLIAGGRRYEGESS